MLILFANQNLDQENKSRKMTLDGLNNSTSLFIYCIFIFLLNNQPMFKCDQNVGSVPCDNTKIQYSCPDQFMERCHCGLRTYNGPFSEYIGKNRETYVTNCTNAGFTDPNLLSFISCHTEILIFVGNNLTNLTGNTFQTASSYDKLLLVDLSRNNIKMLDENIFKNMKQVQTLILNDNAIQLTNENAQYPLFKSLNNLQELHLRNALNLNQPALGRTNKSILNSVLHRSHLNHLKILNLEQNSISTFSPNDNDLFCSMKKLRRLMLANNLLKHFELNLTCLNELLYLDISENHISNVDNHSLILLQSIPNTYHVNISENPFRCDCYLKDFYHLIRNQTNTNSEQTMDKKRIIFDWFEEFKCHDDGPDITAGKYFDDINENDLECSEPYDGISMVNIVNGEKNITDKQRLEALRRYRYYITLSYIVLAFLLSLLLLLISILIYTNREYIQSSWNILCVQFSTKNDYTVLDKETGSVSVNDKYWWYRINGDKSRSCNYYNHHHYYQNNSPLTSSSNYMVEPEKSNFSNRIRHSANVAEDQL